MTTPNNSIPYVTENTLDPAAGLNLALDVIDALLQTAVIDMDRTAPPVGPADGDLHIVASSPTGAWAGHAGELARYRSVGAFWQFYEARLVFNKDDGGLYILDDATSPGTWRFLVLAGGLTLQDEDSPPSVTVEGTKIMIIGAGLLLEEVAPGVARISATT